MTDRVNTGAMPRLLLAGAAGLLMAALPPALTVHAAAVAASIEDNGNNGCVTGSGGQGSTYCFIPEVASAAPGDTVTWTNNSTATHTVTRCTVVACPVGPGSGSDPTFGSGSLSTSATFAQVFTAPGTYNYYCNIHGYALMHGSVVVTALSVTPAQQPAGSTAANSAPTAAAAAATTATPTPTPKITGFPKTGGAAPATATRNSGESSGWILVALVALVVVPSTLAIRTRRRSHRSL